MNLKVRFKVRISIITLTKNVEHTLEKTIRSVIDQQYPNTEFMIFDGGSTDGTLDIIKKYEAHLAYWQSKPDNAPDYNIALPKATGEIICFLNADDWYEGNILYKAADTFKRQPDLALLSCDAQLIQKIKGTYHHLSKFNEKKLALTIKNSIRYPAINARFFCREIIEKFTPFSTFNDRGEYQYTHDKKFMLKLAMNNLKSGHINQIGHTFLKHNKSITFSGKTDVVLKSCEEHMELAEQYPENTLLKQWYNENLCRYIIRALYSGQLKAAFKKIKLANQKNIHWQLTMFKTIFRIIRNKLKN